MIKIGQLCDLCEDRSPARKDPRSGLLMTSVEDYSGCGLSWKNEYLWEFT